MSVSLMISMLKGMSPSAGTGNFISLGSISFGLSEVPEPSDFSGSVSITMSPIQAQNLCSCWITETFTNFCRSSSDSGWLLYVDIFSYKIRKKISIRVFYINTGISVQLRLCISLKCCLLTLALKVKEGLNNLWYSSKETLYLVFEKPTFAVLLYVMPEKGDIVTGVSTTNKKKSWLDSKK